MEMLKPEDYNIFTALLETIHKKNLVRLRFAKCQNCGRLTPFRLISINSDTVKCKKCGNSVYLTSNRENNVKSGFKKQNSEKS